MARYLVTGGAGFIGSHLVEALLRGGHEVAVLDNLFTGKIQNLNGSGVELIEGDVTDPRLVWEAAAGVSGIFHLAALGSVPRSFEDPRATSAANVGGTKAVIAAARVSGVARVVLSSSSSVYGDNGTPVRRESHPPSPLSPYAESKLAAERLCLSSRADGGPEAVVLRYFNVYGPRQDPSSRYAAAIPRFVSRLIEGEPPQIYGDGEQTRDFTYVEDVVAGTLAAMLVPSAAGRVINVGSGRSTSVNQLVELLGEIVGGFLQPEYLPARPGEVRDSIADTSLACNLLGYRPKHSLTQGLQATVTWHRRELVTSTSFPGQRDGGRDVEQR